ncbi:MAG: twin-arginine translocase TatA/TatE family subunit [Bacteroidales bacterium]|jgi:sec-independent protein translocase protein TatA|nr:twin-arginine translocase TatA/TatE family subunit [Bacteroidales bacterium]
MNGLIFLGVLGPWQIVLILAIVLLLFGGKKIPELMKGLGKGIRNFKEGMNNPDEEEKETRTKE